MDNLLFKFKDSYIQTICYHKDITFLSIGNVYWDNDLLDVKGIKKEKISNLSQLYSLMRNNACRNLAINGKQLE